MVGRQLPADASATEYVPQARAGRIDHSPPIRVTPTEYLPETVTRRATLDYGQHLDVQFRPKNPGEIAIRSFAPAERDSETLRPNPTSRRIELYEPRADRPVATATSEVGVTSFLKWTVSPEALSRSGDWTARVTNTEAESLDPVRAFELSATYPGVRLERAEIPVAQLRDALQAALGGLAVRVTSGRNDSYVRLDTAAEYRFTAPDCNYASQNVVIRERIRDVNSLAGPTASFRNASSRFPRGSLAIDIDFETAGTEYQGTYRGEIHRPTLALELGLSVADGTVTYDPATPSASAFFGAEWPIVEVAGAEVASVLFQYDHDVGRSVERAATRAFASDAFRRPVEDRLTSVVRNQLGVPSAATIHDVRVENDRFVVKYAAA